MKSIRVAIWLALLGGCAALAHAQDFETLRLNDAAWVRESADRLARCAGTYRGTAEVMRRSGREEAARYAEGVGSGALFAAYLLLTSPTAVEAKVLSDVDTNVHIEALAWGTKQNFLAKDAEGDSALPEILGVCIRTSSLQSAVLRNSIESAATADARPVL